MKYSVEEMDRMRKAIQDLHVTSWHRYSDGAFGGGSMGDNRKIVEEYLRSYMLNGTTPEELEQAAEEKIRNAPLVEQ